MPAKRRYYVASKSKRPGQHGVLILTMSRRPMDYLDRCFRGNDMIGNIYAEGSIATRDTMFASIRIDAGLMRGEASIALNPAEVAIINRLEARIARRMAEELMDADMAYKGPITE